MLSEFCLNHIIEKLRVQMVELALKKGSLLDHDVIELSQRLDVYIVRLQKLMKERAGQRIAAPAARPAVMRTTYVVMKEKKLVDPA
ncbi:aspartyl-phosphate phosphatase Spo0E family protein [Paenibacillus silviterrae]|uniref:aspartyl-phosphate phosphatase Spo0E family protein n=1 Tax=Paenibacillus silviterrae TaxID=3242194 RepID=UPI002542FA25|nr:aspartyl-phosphate phosphatase Spo0E family protein [Paenibacillus chinjuensis]